MNIIPCYYFFLLSFCFWKENTLKKYFLSVLFFSRKAIKMVWVQEKISKYLKSSIFSLLRRYWKGNIITNIKCLQKDSLSISRRLFDLVDTYSKICSQQMKIKGRMILTENNVYIFKLKNMLNHQGKLPMDM